MNRSAVAATLMVSCAAPAAAQLPSWPNPLDALLREESRLHLRSSLTALRCCAHERGVDVLLAWPADTPVRGLGLRLLAGTAATRSDRYTRSGLEGVFGDVVGRVALSASAGVAAGGGVGPRRVWSAAFGAETSELSFELRTTWLQDTPADSLLPGAVAPALLDAQYTDGELVARHRLGRVEISATGGIRFGATMNDTPQWLSGEVDVPVWRRISLVTAAGLRPKRPELAQAAGRFALLALRLHLQPREPAAAPPAPDSSAPAFVVTPLSPGKYLLRIRVTAARSVELTGDVTDWRVLTLRRIASAAQWELTIEKAPGIYHVNIRIDGGDWLVPPGLPAVPDRFGGQSGLLHLPPVEERNHDDR